MGSFGYSELPTALYANIQARNIGLWISTNLINPKSKIQNNETTSPVDDTPLPTHTRAGVATRHLPILS